MSKAPTPRTTVVNIKLHEYDVYCGRAGHGEAGTFGNQFNTGPKEVRLSRFAAWFFLRVRSDQRYREQVEKLKGKRLGCFCVKEPWTVDSADQTIRCHVQYIARYLDTGK